MRDPPTVFELLASRHYRDRAPGIVVGQMAGAYDLQRFVDAQDQGGIYEGALAEVRAGRKTSHWMWFVFPQIAGLGQSPVSRRFAISSLDEARAYLADPVLGPRLIESTRALTQLPTASAEEVFGGRAARLKERASQNRRAWRARTVTAEPDGKRQAGARQPVRGRLT